MSEKTFPIRVCDRAGKELYLVHLKPYTRILDLKVLIESQSSILSFFSNSLAGIAMERQYLTLGKYFEGQTEPTKMNEDFKKLSDYRLDQEGYVITVKDLGPQIGYRTVFIVEYLGPILIFTLNHLWASHHKALAKIQE